MSSSKNGFERWAAKKLSQPGFARSYGAARRHVDAVDGLVRALDSVREASGLSKAELARAIDAKPEIVRRLFTKQGANPTLQTVVEIAAALGLELRLVPVAKAQVRRRRKSSEQRAVA